jgi:RimJ/RimL family protein N-acetyltransferase
MGAGEIIAGMKRDRWDEAWSLRVPVLDDQKKTIGSLVPVGKWILEDADKVEAIRAWRQNAMRMFLTQFESTSERTRSYLRDLSIAEPDRLFFLSHDGSDRCVGHIGISAVAAGSGELDNVMRGAAGGHLRLTYFSGLALLNWCFTKLDMSRCVLRVLSYNIKAIALYEEIGFSMAEQVPLRRVERDGMVVHEPVKESEANVDYFCIHMGLTKEAFYAKGG